MNRTLILSATATLLTLAVLPGCREAHPLPAEPIENTPLLPIESPQDLLVAAIREVEEVSDISGSGRIAAGNAADKGGPPVFAVEADTLYVYGELTPDGFGAVVSERHTYPRGIPLITVRKSFGRNGRIVSEANRYTSSASFRANDPAQTTSTELYGLSRDTIVTYVLRNGLLETFTFRLPVITVTIGATADATRRLSRFGLNGEIVVETRDGNGLLLQTRTSSSGADGGLITRTEYADGSWRTTRTLGMADGSILRENNSSRP